MRKQSQRQNKKLLIIPSIQLCKRPSAYHRAAFLCTRHSEMRCGKRKR